MAYDPPPTIVTRLYGDDPIWSTVVNNNSEVQATYNPAIIDQPWLITTTSTSFTTRAHFRVRTNAALHPVRFRFRAGCTVGAGTIKCAVGAASTDQAVTGAQAWYTVDVTPLVSAPDCSIQTKVTTGGDSLEITALQVYLVPAAGSDVAGWVDVDETVWATTDSPIPSRVVEDLLNGVVLVARDRPFCIFSRVADVQATVTGKSPEAWGVDNSTTWQVAGRAFLGERNSIATRGTCRLDAYVTRTGTADVSVAIGAARWEFTASSDGWYTTTLQLDTGAPIVVSAAPGATDEVAVRTLQIWRGG